MAWSYVNEMGVVMYIELTDNQADVLLNQVSDWKHKVVKGSDLQRQLEEIEKVLVLAILQKEGALTMDKAQQKKRFYNRVRRTCLKHNIDIVYDGVPKAVYGVELVKDGVVMFADRTNDNMPLDINWQRLHEEMTDYGYKGGVK